MLPSHSWISVESDKLENHRARSNKKFECFNRRRTSFKSHFATASNKTHTFLDDVGFRCFIYLISHCMLCVLCLRIQRVKCIQTRLTERAHICALVLAFIWHTDHPSIIHNFVSIEYSHLEILFIFRAIENGCVVRVTWTLQTQLAQILSNIQIHLSYNGFIANYPNYTLKQMQNGKKRRWSICSTLADAIDGIIHHAINCFHLSSLYQ